MKVLAINTSPNKDKGYTHKIVAPFLDGARQAGAEVEMIFTSGMHIEECRQCTSNFNFESDGHCQCDDDMQKLYPSFRNSDIWVFATPSSCSSATFALRNIMDRLEPLLSGSEDFQDYQDSILPKGKIALISACDMWDPANFADLDAEFENLARVFNKVYAGSLLRPHANALNALEDLKIKIDDVIDSAKAAGHEIVVNGVIPEELRHSISRTLIPKDSFILEVNKLFAGRI